MSVSGGELLIVEHIKYRNSEAGKSPIGTLFIFKDRVEWRDSSSLNLVTSFGEMKGLRVSPPNKPKVQLEICMQDDSQSTFVFMRPGADQDSLMKERDATKETLQQALISHRKLVKKMAQEEESRKAKLEEKKKILEELTEVCAHLLTTKLITPQDFWTDYYKIKKGKQEESTGLTGTFLANIVQWKTDGLHLNLNPSIIQNIFAIYPMVERKHLELVPYEMEDKEFWVKFVSSHYFHREREVLPNTEDPFADCVKYDEEEMAKLIDGGPKRKRLDFTYLDDNIFAEMKWVQEPKRRCIMKVEEKPMTMLFRRCNHFSERILTTQLSAGATIEETGPSGSGGGVASVASVKGYAVMNRWMGGETSEDVLESSELGLDWSCEEDEQQLHSIKVQDGTIIAEAEHPPEAAELYRSIVLKFIEEVSEQDILEPPEEWFAPCSSSASDDSAKNDLRPTSLRLNPSTQWGSLVPFVGEIRLVHDTVNELARHFWTCFPPVTPELESKLDRMEETLKRYESTMLLEVEHRFGSDTFLHCRDMISRAHNRYAQDLKYRRKK